MGRQRDEPRRRHGRFTRARVAWARLGTTEFIIYDRREGDDDLPAEWVAQAPDLAEVSLTISGAGRRQVTVNLTEMTSAELDSLEQIFTQALDMARPISEELDRRAEEGFQHGDDSFIRLYRPVPELHQRPRDEPPHDPGVPG